MGDDDRLLPEGVQRGESPFVDAEWASQNGDDYRLLDGLNLSRGYEFSSDQENPENIGWASQNGDEHGILDGLNLSRGHELNSSQGDPEKIGWAFETISQQEYNILEDTVNNLNPTDDNEIDAGQPPPAAMFAGAAPLRTFRDEPPTLVDELPATKKRNKPSTSEDELPATKKRRVVDTKNTEGKHTKVPRSMPQYQRGGVGVTPLSHLESATAPPSDSRYNKKAVPTLTADNTAAATKRVIETGNRETIESALALTVEQLKYVQIDIEATDNKEVMRAYARIHKIKKVDTIAAKLMLTGFQTELTKSVAALNKALKDLQ